jgi:hypothetical protein
VKKYGFEYLTSMKLYSNSKKNYRTYGFKHLIKSFCNITQNENIEHVTHLIYIYIYYIHNNKFSFASFSQKALIDEHTYRQLEIPWILEYFKHFFGKTKWVIRTCGGVIFSQEASASFERSSRYVTGGPKEFICIDTTVGTCYMYCNFEFL